MKKFIIFIMFVFVLIPGIALADDINLEIKEVKLVEKSENAEVVNNPVIDGLSVKTDIRLNILSDYVKYKIIIKNKDNVDLNVKIDEFDKNDYITYIVDKNIDKKISANSEEIIYVTIKYEKEIENFIDETYDFENSFSFTIEGEEEPTTTAAENVKKEEEIKNPETGLKDYTIVIGFMIIIGLLVVYLMYKNKTYFKTFMFIIVLNILVIPITLKAISLAQVKISFKVSIPKYPNIYTVFINPNGGIYDESKDETIIKLIDGKTMMLSRPKRDGFVFSKWEVDGNSNSTYDEINNKVKIKESDIKLKALWIPESEAVARIKETNVIYKSIQLAFDAAIDGQTVILERTTSENPVNLKKIKYDLNGFTQNGRLVNVGSIVVYGGSIDSSDVGIVNQGELTLGIDDDEIHSRDCKIGEETGCVSIKGTGIGVQNDGGKFNFYDGYIKGTYAIIGGCTKTPIKSDKTYYKAAVDKEPRVGQAAFVNDSDMPVSKTTTNGDVYYYYLDDNIFTSYYTGYKINIVRDFDMSYGITIDEKKEITIDLGGYEVKTGNDIKNNGTLNIDNTSSKKGRISMLNSLINTGTLNINNIELAGKKTMTVKNNKTLNVAKSNITSEDSYAISTSSKGEVVMDDVSLCSSKTSNAIYIPSNIEYKVTGGNISSMEASSVMNNGKLTLDKVNVNGHESYGVYNKGTLNVTSGNYVGKKKYSLYNYSNSTLIVSGGTFTGEEENTFFNSGTATINGGAFKNTNLASVVNKNTLTINDGKFESTNSNALANYDECYINNGNFISENSTSILNAPLVRENYSDLISNLTINNATIKSKGTSTSSYGIENKCNLSILKGKIESDNSYGIYNTASLNIGVDDTEVSSDGPIIKGSTYGVYSNGEKFTYYDGRILGHTAGHFGNITDTSKDMVIKEKTSKYDNQNYQETYLSGVSYFLSTSWGLFSSFQSAIDSISSSGTITVKSSTEINETFTIPSGKNITINLGTNMITNSGTIYNYGTLTIKGKGSGKYGIIRNPLGTVIENGKWAYEMGRVNTSPGTLTLQDVYFLSEEGITAKNISGGMTIKDSMISSDNNYALYTKSRETNNDNVKVYSSMIYSIENYGIYNRGDIDLYGGTFSSTSKAAIYNYYTGTLEINGSTNEVFSRESYAIENNGGMLYIRSGKIKASKKTAILNEGVPSSSASYIEINGGTITSEGENDDDYAIYNGERGEIRLKGGEINSTSSHAIYNTNSLIIGNKFDSMFTDDPVITGDKYGVYNADGTMEFYDGTIKGKTGSYYGTFSHITDGTMIKNETGFVYKTSYLAKMEDYVLADGKTYSSINDAIDGLGGTGTIKLTRSVNTTQGFSVDRTENITLDLNGKSLVTNDAIANYGKLTIMDSVGGGSITNNEGNLFLSSYIGINTPSTIIRGVTLKSKGKTISITNSNLVIENSTITSVDNLAIDASSSSSGYTISITKSEILSKNGSAISNQNGSTLTFNSGSISSPDKAIVNDGVLNINGGTITSSKTAITNSRTCLITGGTITSTSEVAVLNSTYSASIVMNGGKIFATGADALAYGINNAGNLTITNGEVKSSNSHGIYNKSSLTIGSSSGEYSKDNLKIIGKTYGVYSDNHSFKFYDGSLIGSTDGFFGNIEYIRSGYALETDANDDYFVRYLDKNSGDHIKNMQTNKTYSVLMQAIMDATSGDTLQVTRDYFESGGAYIQDGKEITIDFNGKKMSIVSSISNSGTLILKNSKESGLNLNSYSSSGIVNSGTLELNNIVMNASITNLSNLKVNSSSITGSNGINSYGSGNGAGLEINNSKIYGESQGIYCNSPISMKDSYVYSKDRVFYYGERSNTQSDITNTDFHSENVLSSSAFYTYGNLNLTNVSTNTGINNTGTLSFKDGSIGSMILNSYNMTLDNISIDMNFVSSESTGYYSPSINNSGQNLEIKNSKININVNLPQNTIIGILNSGTLKMSDTSYNLSADGENNEMTFGILNNYGDFTLSGIEFNLNSKKSITGVYSNSSSTLDFESGSVSVNSLKDAKGVLISGGTFNLGIPDSVDNEFYGTLNGDVNSGNPKITANGTSTGIGIDINYGYFNYYDGLIKGNTLAKNAVPANIEFKYRDKITRKSDGFEYCSLEYIKE